MYNCPRDGHQLQTKSDKAPHLWSCNICDGGLTEWQKERPRKFVGSAHPREAWDSEVRCPKDGAQMVHFKYQGVALDLCNKCGWVWMDGGEIAKALNVTG